MSVRGNGSATGVRLRWFAGEEDASSAAADALVWRLQTDARVVVTEQVDSTQSSQPSGADGGAAALREWVGRGIFSTTAEGSLADVAGVIIVVLKPRPEFEDEFNDWYNTEHVPTLVKVPGIIQARRYVEESSRSYLALYLCTSVDVMQSDDWRVAVKRTPWTERMVAKGIENMEGLVPASLVSGRIGSETLWSEA